MLVFLDYVLCLRTLTPCVDIVYGALVGVFLHAVWSTALLYTLSTCTAHCVATAVGVTSTVHAALMHVSRPFPC